VWCVGVWCVGVWLGRSLWVGGSAKSLHSVLKRSTLICNAYKTFESISILNSKSLIYVWVCGACGCVVCVGVGGLVWVCGVCGCVVCLWCVCGWVGVGVVCVRCVCGGMCVGVWGVCGMSGCA